MSRASPFAGVSRLVVDGNNLLHRTAGGLGPGGSRLLVAQLRAVLPAGAEALILLDGMPDPGGPMRERVGAIEIAHAGRRSADDAIVEAVERRAWAERAAMVVVTDDRALAERIKRLGALHRRIDWLQDALELRRRGPRSGPSAGSSAGSSVGSARSAPPPGSTAGTVGGSGAGAADAVDAEDARTPWTPGRGATRKRGNPRRRRSPR